MSPPCARRPHGETHRERRNNIRVFTFFNHLRSLKNTALFYAAEMIWTKSKIYISEELKKVVP